MYRATKGAEVIGVVVSQGKIVSGVTYFSNPRGVTEFKRVRVSKRQIKSDKLYNSIFGLSKAEVERIIQENPEDNILIKSHIRGVISKKYPWERIHRR